MLSQYKTFTLLLLLSVAGCRNQADYGNAYDLDKPGLVHVGPHARNPPYRWGFVNRGKVDIDGVGIEWLRPHNFLSANAGVLRATTLGGEAFDNSGWDPIPDDVTLSWRENGEQRHQRLEVAPLILDLPNFTGTIMLTYDGTLWHVSTKPPPPNVFQLK